MVISLHELLSFWGIMFLLGIMPGLGFVNIVNFTVSQGRKNGVIAAAGTIGADVFYLLVTVSGLTIVMNFFSHYGNWMKGAGMAVLFFFALEKFFSTPNPAAWKARADYPTKYFRVFLFCWGLSISNPKVFIFYFAFLPGIFDLSQAGIVDISLILLTLIFALGTAFAIVVLSADSLSRYLASARRMKFFNITAGIIFLFFSWQIARTIF